LHDLLPLTNWPKSFVLTLSLVIKVGPTKCLAFSNLYMHKILYLTKKITRMTQKCRKILKTLLLKLNANEIYLNPSQWNQKTIDGGCIQKI